MKTNSQIESEEKEGERKVWSVAEWFALVLLIVIAIGACLAFKALSFP